MYRCWTTVRRAGGRSLRLLGAQSPRKAYEIHEADLKRPARCCGARTAPRAWRPSHPGRSCAVFANRRSTLDVRFAGVPTARWCAGSCMASWSKRIHERRQESALDPKRQAHQRVQLCRKYGKERLDAMCSSLDFDVVDVPRLGGMLKKARKVEQGPADDLVRRRGRRQRRASGALAGGRSSVFLPVCAALARARRRASRRASRVELPISGP